MKQDLKKIINFGLNKILFAVAKFCLRHSIRVQDLWELTKIAFVKAAEEELKTSSHKITTSKISVMTGLQRREVDKILSGGISVNDTSPKDLISKVIGQWLNDKNFITKNGEPRVLSFGDMQSEFYKLTAKVSNDLNPATVLYELERTGVIEKSPRGVKLVLNSYSPSGDYEKGFSILGEDVEDLISSVEENILYPAGDKRDQSNNLHARTIYDNVKNDALPALKKWILEEGHKFHSKLRDEISKYDLDINPDTKFKGKTAKVIVGSFGRIIGKKEVNNYENS